MSRASLLTETCSDPDASSPHLCWGGDLFVVTPCVMSRVPASVGVESCVPGDDDPLYRTGVRCSAAGSVPSAISSEAATRDGTQHSFFSVFLYFFGLCLHVNSNALASGSAILLRHPSLFCELAVGVVQFEAPASRAPSDSTI